MHTLASLAIASLKLANRLSYKKVDLLTPLRLTRSGFGKHVSQWDQPKFQVFFMIGEGVQNLEDGTFYLRYPDTVQARQWQANTINTAAQNAINQQNAQNAFNLSNQALSNLWQELRDQADYDFKTIDNEEQRKTALFVAALGNEGASYQGKNWTENISSIASIVNNFTFGSQSSNTNPYRGFNFGGGV